MGMGMEIPFTSETLFWGGIAVMVLAAVLMLLGLLIFRITGKRLRRKLEEEYGKRQ